MQMLVQKYVLNHSWAFLLWQLDMLHLDTGQQGVPALNEAVLKVASTVKNVWVDEDWCVSGSFVTNFPNLSFLWSLTVTCVYELKIQCIGLRHYDLAWYGHCTVVSIQKSSQAWNCSALLAKSSSTGNKILGSSQCELFTIFIDLDVIIPKRSEHC